MVPPEMMQALEDEKKRRSEDLARLLQATLGGGSIGSGAPPLGSMPMSQPMVQGTPQPQPNGGMAPLADLLGQAARRFGPSFIGAANRPMSPGAPMEAPTPPSGGAAGHLADLLGQAARQFGPKLFGAGRPTQPETPSWMEAVDPRSMLLGLQRDIGPTTVGSGPPPGTAGAAPRLLGGPKFPDWASTPEDESQMDAGPVGADSQAQTFQPTQEAQEDPGVLMKSLGHWLNWAGQQRYASPTFEGVHEFGGTPGLGNALISAGEDRSQILTPEERAVMEAALPNGMRLPAGMTRKQADESPILRASAIAQGRETAAGRMANTATALELSQGRLDLSREKEENLQGHREFLRQVASSRLQTTRDRMEVDILKSMAAVDRQQLLDSSQHRDLVDDIESIRGWDWVKKNWDDVLNQANGNAGLPAGWMAGRWAQLKQGIGLNDADTATFTSALRQAVGRQVTSDTGSQRGMKEVEWIKVGLPDLIENPEVFEAHLEEHMGHIRNEVQRKLEMYAGNGKNVESYAKWVGVSGNFAPSGAFGASAQALREKGREVLGMGPAASAGQASPAPTAKPAAGSTLMVTWPDGTVEPYDLSGASEETILDRIKKIENAKGTVERR